MKGNRCEEGEKEERRRVNIPGDRRMCTVCAAVGRQRPQGAERRLVSWSPGNEQGPEGPDLVRGFGLVLGIIGSLQVF